MLSRVSREHRELVAVTAVMLPDVSRTGQAAFCVNAHGAPVTLHVWSCYGTKGGGVFTHRFGVMYKFQSVYTDIHSMLVSSGSLQRQTNLFFSLS